MKSRCLPDWIWKTTSVISVIISVSLALVLLPSELPLKFDYLGFFVGILAVLVTLLVGFQIFNFFAISERLSAVEKTLRENKSFIEKAKKDIEKEHCYCKASTIFISVNEEHHDLVSSESQDVKEYMKVYLLYCCCVKLYIHSGYYDNFRICLLNMDRAISAIIKIRKGIKLTDHVEFFNNCDKEYSQMIPILGSLASEDIDILHKVRIRRESLATDQPLDPVFLSPNKQ